MGRSQFISLAISFPEPPLLPVPMVPTAFYVVSECLPSSFQFTVSVLTELISFLSYFYHLHVPFKSLAVFCSKFPLLLSTYSLTSLPRQFNSAVNGGPVSILKQEDI